MFAEIQRDDCGAPVFTAGSLILENVFGFIVLWVNCSGQISPRPTKLSLKEVVCTAV